MESSWTVAPHNRSRTPRPTSRRGFRVRPTRAKTASPVVSRRPVSCGSSAAESAPHPRGGLRFDPGLRHGGQNEMNAPASLPGTVGVQNQSSAAEPGWFARAGEPRALDRREELTLVRQAQAGDRQALERLIQANRRLIVREARRVAASAQSFQDLVQEGALAFVEALAGYDQDRGFRLMTYALHGVRRSVAAAAARERAPLSPGGPEMVSLESPAASDSDSAL